SDGRGKEGPAGRSDPAASGGRSRAQGTLGELPQGGKHLLHRRPDPAHRDRASQDAQSGPEIAERDQGSSGLARADSRHEARELAAGRSGDRPDLLNRSEGIRRRYTGSGLGSSIAYAVIV